MSGATLSLSTNCFLPEMLGECLECAARLGLAGVELGPRNAVRLFESTGERRAAAAAFDRLGLRPLSVHAWTGAEGLEAVAPFAAEFGGGLIVVHAPHAALEAGFDGQVRELARWDRWCRERGVTLTVENESRQRVGRFAALLAAVPGLRVTLDFKHAWKPEMLGTTHRDFWPHVSGRLANLHLAGIDRSRDELGDGCPPGDADAVDWRELGRELAALGYAGLATAELSFPRHLADAEIEAAYAALGGPEPGFPTPMHRLARNGVGYFRGALAPALAGPGGAEGRACG